MPTTKPPYPSAFRQQMVELVQAGRTPAQLAREFKVSAQSISMWVARPLPTVANRCAAKTS